MLQLLCILLSNQQKGRAMRLCLGTRIAHRLPPCADVAQAARCSSLGKLHAVMASHQAHR